MINENKLNSLEKIGPTEKDIEKPQISPEEQINKLEKNAEIKKQQIAEFGESTEKTKDELNKVRERIGLPPSNEEPPSILKDERNLEKLKKEQEVIEKQKKDILAQKEREALIQKEKNEIIQEKISGLFEEFKLLNYQEFESISKTGKTNGDERMKSNTIGTLDPETAKLLANAFKKGVRALSEVLINLPDFLKKIDEELTQEAEERVDKKIAEEKEKTSKKKNKNITEEEKENTGINKLPEQKSEEIKKRDA